MRDYLRAANVGWDGLLLDDVKRMNFTDAEMAAFRLEPGDLLLNEASGSPLEVGKPALWQGEIEECAFQNTLLRVRPGPEIDPRYLLHFFRHEAVTGAFARGSRGVGIHHLGRAALSEWSVPLCCLDEQRRIAAILDHADALRAKRRQVVGDLDDLSRSIFLDTFGEFSGAFATVDGVASPGKGSIRTGPFGSQLLHSEFVDSGISVLGLDNVVGNEFSWGERRFITAAKYEGLRRYTVHPGDVLVSIMGTCGRCVVVPPDIGRAINTKHICAITLDAQRALPEFVRAAFLWHPRSRQHLKQQTKGSIMDGLNMGIIKTMPLPVPPVDMQRDFVARLGALGSVSRSSALSAGELDSAFRSLQSRAFRGEL